MYNYLDMEFVQALNPLYAFPIVAVIVCAFIVYAFGFKSPVQPPSFEGIEEEKKVSKKRKSKETSKQGKLVQNGKVNGSTISKPHISPPGKKKDVEKSTSTDKIETEKSTISEKKASKKAKSQNEKRNMQEKKKETFVNEDASEDGWVHLVSKKGRKNRRKDEIISAENQSKSVKNSELGKSDESSLPSDESLEKTEFSMQSSVEKVQSAFKEEKLRKKESANEVNKPVSKDEKSKKKESKEEKTVLGVPSNTEMSIEKVDVGIKADSKSLDKIPSKENMKSGKLIEESSNKSKKKKKKNPEINTDNESLISISETPPLQENSELSVKNAAIDSAVVETSQLVNSEIEENKTKVSKSSNVVFDELAGLYPEAIEQRKKRRVRRDH